MNGANSLFGRIKFNLIDSEDRVKVWWQKDERYLPECTAKTVRGGEGSIMFWGCIGFDFIGSLIEIKGHLNANFNIFMLWSRGYYNGLYASPEGHINLEWPQGATGDHTGISLRNPAFDYLPPLVGMET